MAGTSSEYNIHMDIMFFFSFHPSFTLRCFFYQLEFRPSTRTLFCRNPLWWAIYKSLKSTIHAYNRWFIFFI